MYQLYMINTRTMKAKKQKMEILLEIVNKRNFGAEATSITHKGKLR